jgi:putative NADH-flavin reductase
MQITILGSTGQVGRAALKEALHLGYRVKVLVRSPDKLGDLKGKVMLIIGDLTDSLSVGKSLDGSEAVINAAGGVKESHQFEKFQQIGKILVAQMKERGISRLINISGAVAKLSNETMDMNRKLMGVMVNLFYHQMKRAQEGIMPVIEQATDISWTFVRAAMISKNPGTGKIIADDKKMPGTKIMLEDLGKFMLEQVNSTQWIKKAPFVASGRL